MRRVLGGLFLLCAFLAHSQSARALLCSGGIDDGADCLVDGDCSGGVCVRTGGVCDGGSDDGRPCESTCADARPCVTAYRICIAGGNAGAYCLRNAHCGGTSCTSTGARCTGGDYDQQPCNSPGDCPGGTCFSPAPTPTATTPELPSPTSTAPVATPTPTLTPSRTSTPPPTQTATPTLPPVTIQLGSARGAPGDLLAVAISITTNDRAVVATANDITFDGGVLSLAPESCRVNPAVGKTLRASSLPAAGNQQTVRVLIQSAQNLDAIPDGLLFTCSVRVATSALPGRYTLKSGIVIAYDATGAALAPAGGENGTVSVSLIGGRCAGDCNDDGDVTIDEIIGGVGIALGTRLVDTCSSIDASGDGDVTVDEIIQAVSNALNGCVIAPTPLPTRTPTATPVPTTLYVRASGDNQQDGSSPEQALASIALANNRARSGYRIVVGPGTYLESVITSTSGSAPQALQFVADTSGRLTGDAPGAVVMDAAAFGNGVGFRLSNSSGTSIDGFTIINASDAGIVVRGGSDDVTIRNCDIHDGSGAGIRVQDSSDVLIVNNLINNNGAQGIAIVGNGSGSPKARLFSNTVVANGDRGITIGTSNVASPNALLRNNILQGNGLRATPPLENIKVFTQPASTAGYNGDYNLVYPPTYLPQTITGLHDVLVDATFEFAAGDDFRLRPGSPAIDAGDQLPRDIEAQLYERATGAGGLDGGRLDLGFHFQP